MRLANPTFIVTEFPADLAAPARKRNVWHRAHASDGEEYGDEPKDRRSRARATLLVATRKGLWPLTSDAARRAWKLAGPQFLGHIVHHAMPTRATAEPCWRPRARAISVRRSSARPTAAVPGTKPRGRRRSRRQRPRRRTHVLAHARARVAARRLVRGHVAPGAVPLRPTAERPGTASTASTSTRSARPGAAATRTARRTARSCTRFSIDPRDPEAHVHRHVERRRVRVGDGGADWRPLNRGVRADFLPDPDPEYGHDPHCVRFAPAQPDRLYQQNHCGIYRLDRPAERWPDIGATMPKSVGAIGFPMVAASARPRHAVGVPDGRLERLAARVARRQAGRLSLRQRRPDLAAPGDAACPRRRHGGPSSARR